MRWEKSSPECSAQGQVFHCKCRPSTANSETKVAVLLEMNRCTRFSLLSTPHSLSLASEQTLKISCCCCCRVLRHFLTSYVMSFTSDIEREKSDKFCSEVLILAWGSFTYRKSTTQDPQLYFPSKGSHTQDFYAQKKSIDPANLGSRGKYDKHWTTWVDLKRSMGPQRGGEESGFG